MVSPPLEEPLYLRDEVWKDLSTLPVSDRADRQAHDLFIVKLEELGGRAGYLLSVHERLLKRLLKRLGVSPSLTKRLSHELDING